jgi:hypothetical protein
MPKNQNFQYFQMGWPIEKQHRYRAPVQPGQGKPARYPLMGGPRLCEGLEVATYRPGKRRTVPLDALLEAPDTYTVVRFPNLLSVRWHHSV